MKYINKYRYILIVLVLIIVAVAFLTKNNQKNSIVVSSENVKKVSLLDLANLFNESRTTETIGQIDSNQSVEMKAQVSGTVQTVNVKIGDRVYIGKTIATFNNADSYASLAQAEAGVKIQQARLDELTGSARSEDVAVAELSVKNTEAALLNAKKTAIDSVRDAYVKTDDVMFSKIDQIFNNPRSNPKITFETNNYALESAIETERYSLEDFLTEWNSQTASLGVSDDLNLALDNAKNNLSRISKYLDMVATIVNSIEGNNTLSQTTIDLYRLNASTARTTISGAASLIVSAQNNLSGAVTSFEQSKQQLVIKEKGGTSDQVKAQQALLEQAQANLLSAKAQYAKTVFTSPINGEIASLPVKVGQYVSMGQLVVKVINKNDLHIKAYINTGDADFVKAGDSVSVKDIGEATVEAVSPGIDSQSGKIEIYISLPTELKQKVIEGEYVNISIHSTAVQKELGWKITLPIRAIKVKSNGSSVYVIGEDGLVEEVEVQTGNIIGNEVEIISGLNASVSIIASTRGLSVGDKVIEE